MYRLIKFLKEERGIDIEEYQIFVSFINLYIFVIIITKNKKIVKKLIYLILLAIPLMFSSCEKQKYCAQCYENISGYQASDFCGESDEIDEYIQELNSQSYFSVEIKNNLVFIP